MRANSKKRVETDSSPDPLTKPEDAFPKMNLPDGPDQPSHANQTPTPLRKLGRVVLRRETAHRGGKTVIVVDQFATHLPLSVIETVAKKLRKACGSGGAIKGRTIEIQGDQAAPVRGALEKEGFDVGGVR